MEVALIKNFKGKPTDDLYHGIKSNDARKIPLNIWNVAHRKLDMLNSAEELRDLLAFPGNRLEALRGGLKGKYSIRINDQFRIIFRFEAGNAFDVEIMDYH